MATNLPTNIPDLINWCNVHTDLWTTSYASIGLSNAQSVAFKALVDTMVENNGQAEMARQASKDATMNFQDSIAAVRITAGAYINLIKAFAETTNNPAVYALAGISPNDPPGTLPAPIAPSDFSAGINGDGSLTIKWKVTQPAGVTGVQYFVSRKLAGENSFTIIGSTGRTKSFTDSTLPYGVDQVQYMVQPRRGEVDGPVSSQFTVQFGVGGGGGGMNIVSTVASPAGPMKMAA